MRYFKKSKYTYNYFQGAIIMYIYYSLMNTVIYCYKKYEILCNISIIYSRLCYFINYVASEKNKGMKNICFRKKYIKI